MFDRCFIMVLLLFESISVVMIDDKYEYSFRVFNDSEGVLLYIFCKICKIYFKMVI